MSTEAPSIAAVPAAKTPILTCVGPVWGADGKGPLNWYGVAGHVPGPTDEKTAESARQIVPTTWTRTLVVTCI